MIYSQNHWKQSNKQLQNLRHCSKRSGAMLVQNYSTLSCITFSFQWNYSTHERVEKRRGENSQKNTLFNMFFHYQVHAHATLWNQQVPSVKITDSPANTASSEQTLHLWTSELWKTLAGDLKTDEAFLLAQGFRSLFKGGLWLAAFVERKHPNVLHSYFYYLFIFILEKTCESN